MKNAAFLTLLLLASLSCDSSANTENVTESSAPKTQVETPTAQTVAPDDYCALITLEHAQGLLSCESAPTLTQREQGSSMHCTYLCTSPYGQLVIAFLPFDEPENYQDAIVQNRA